MKTTKPGLRPIWLLLLVVGVVKFASGQTTINPLQQTVMIVNALSGEKTTINMKTVHSISFENKQVKIVKKDATQFSYPFSTIKYIDFGLVDFTSVKEVKSTSNIQLLITPNPVLDNLNLLVENSRNETVNVQILDLQGRVLLQQNMTFFSGQNKNSISVSSLQSGLYLCRLLRGSESIITKFLKN